MNTVALCVSFLELIFISLNIIQQNTYGDGDGRSTITLAQDLLTSCR